MKNVEIKNKLFILLLIVVSTSIYANDLYNKLMLNTVEYFSIDIDINNDGILDKVISGKPYENNELYFFTKENKNYSLLLKGTNFSEDGGNAIYKIEKTSDNMIKITTMFQKGNYREEYYLNYIKDELYLDKVIYIFDDYLDPDKRTDICILEENKKLIDIYNYKLEIKTIPNILEREQKCNIIYNLSNISLDDIIVRIQKDSKENFSMVSRYKALLNEVPLENKTLQKYNDIAYYLQQAKANDEAIFLLEKIIEKFPNRTVAYLNLADAYDGINDKEKAKSNYKKYIELMKKSGKEAKIPKRVLEYK